MVQENYLLAAVVFLAGAVFATGFLMLATFVDPTFMAPQKPVNAALYGAFTAFMMVGGLVLGALGSRDMVNQ